MSRDDRTVRTHIEAVLGSLEASSEQARQFAEERRHLRAALRLLGKRMRNLTLRIVCETDGCKNEGKAINTVSEIGSRAERAAMVEQWSEAHEAADICPACKVLGVPDEGGA